MQGSHSHQTWSSPIAVRSLGFAPHQEQASRRGSPSMVSEKATTLSLPGVEVGSTHLEVQALEPINARGEFHFGGDGSPIRWPSVEATPRDSQGGLTAAIDRPSPRHERLPVGALDVSTSVDPSLVDGLDFASIEARCRLKAEGLRWAVERRLLMAEGGDYRSEIAPKDRDLIDRANGVPGCYLWMNRPDSPTPHAPAMYEEVADWFGMLADAASCVREILGGQEVHRDVLVQALGILAESQSALRVAIGWIGGPDDSDQLDVFAWLRSVARRNRIYLRPLRADAAELPPIRAEVASRIDALTFTLRDAREKSHQKRSQLNRIRYHARRIGKGAGGEHDWRKVAEAIQGMVEDGVPPSSPEIRDLLLPINDRYQELDGLPKGFRLALGGIDRRRVAKQGLPIAVPEGEKTREVAEVARLLRGREVVLIGGKPRHDAQAALHGAFRLEELVWIETKEHESMERFGPYLVRPGVALVLLAIRWSSHSFGDLKRLCERHGKPMVRLPGGYGVNQVAAQILSQCSGQLKQVQHANDDLQGENTLDLRASPGILH